jgi:sporulation protein YlmC with PRC-barrel domain
MLGNQGGLAMEPKLAREKGVIVRASEDVIGKNVVNLAGEHLGQIHELMIDTTTGRVTYAVVSFGGFAGFGDKLFAVPWVSLKYDRVEHVFAMKADKELLKHAPGFHKDNWPDMSDPARRSALHTYYGVTEIVD